MPVKSWNDLLSDAGGAGNSFDPIPEGDYDFNIKECEAKLAQSGRMMYVAKCEVESGPHKSRLVWHNFVLTPDNPNALSWFFRNMNVLGLGREFFAANPSDHQVAEQLRGKRFRGQVGIRKYQGQDRNEIKQFFSATSGSLGNGLPTAAPAAPAPAPAPAAPAPVSAAPAPVAAPVAPVAAAPVVPPAPAFAAPPAAPVVAAPPVVAEVPPAPPVVQPPVPPVVADAAPPVAPPVPVVEAPAPPPVAEAPAPVPPPVAAPAVAAPEVAGSVPPPPPF